MAKLNKTQINAVCEKLRREFEKKLDAKMKVLEKSMPSEDQIEALNVKHIADLIKSSNLPDVIKTIMVAKPNHYCDHPIMCIIEKASKKQKDAIGLPYPDPDSVDTVYDARYEINEKFETQLENLKFELVMAGSEDYQDFMKNFEKAVAKLLD